MIGLGTIVNFIAILICGFIGLMLKKGLSEKLKNSIMMIMGISVVVMGFIGVLENTFSINNGNLENKNFMFIILSLVIGTIIGEIIDIEKKFDKCGRWLKSLIKNNNDNCFIDGFVTSSILFCVGAMGILGAIQDGINADPTLLYTKSILDGITVIIFASTYGLGAVFSAFSVLVYQGFITLISFAINDYVTPNMLANISIVGSIMIICLGFNLFVNLKFRVANMLPSLLIVILFTIFNFF